MATHLLRIAMTTLALATADCAPPQAGMLSSPRSLPAADSRRPDAPVLARKKNGHYRVTRPWSVTLGGRTWQVPKGYSSNGITAPGRIKRTLGDGVDDPETWAAVFHDWLYTQPGMTRDRADQLFYQLLIAYGVTPAKARLMFAGVSTYSATKTPR